MLNILRSFLGQKNSLKGASVLLVITMTLSNILGVIRDHFLAKVIPAERLDIYYASFRLPDLIFNVLILGAIAAAFIPVFTETLKKDKKEAWHIANSLISIGILLVAICLIILYFLMPTLIPYLVPDFDGPKQLETIRFARWMLFSPLFFTVSYFLGGILNSFKHFLLYSMAPLIYNFSIIIATGCFGARYDVSAVIAGVLIGAFLHMLIQLPSAWVLGFRPKIVLDFKNLVVRKVGRLMMPRAIGLGSAQIQLVAFTAFASAIPGAVAIYNLADNIQTVPVVIFGTSLATAVFPTLAEHFKEKPVFQHYFVKTARVILFFTIPATLGILVLRAQVVRLILGYGFFGWAQTRMATDALGFFAIGIVAGALVPLLARSFYALQNTFYPMVVSIIAVIISICLGYVLVGTYGVAGLALAFSLGSWLSFVILLTGLSRRLRYPVGLKFWIDVLKMMTLAVLMVFVMQIVKDWLGEAVDIDRVRWLLLQTTATMAVGALIYLGGAWLWKIPEIRKEDAV